MLAGKTNPHRLRHLPLRVQVSPKYDIEISLYYQTFNCRIWGKMKTYISLQNKVDIHRK